MRLNVELPSRCLRLAAAARSTNNPGQGGNNSSNNAGAPAGARALCTSAGRRAPPSIELPDEKKLAELVAQYAGFRPSAVSMQVGLLNPFFRRDPFSTFAHCF